MAITRQGVNKEQQDKIQHKNLLNKNKNKYKSKVKIKIKVNNYYNSTTNNNQLLTTVYARVYHHQQQRLQEWREDHIQNEEANEGNRQEANEQEL